MTEKPYVASIDVGMLKGEINGVTIKVWTEIGDDPHVLKYGVPTTSRRNREKIERQDHKHPWGKKVTRDPEEYAADARTAREVARRELENRNLDDVSEWHVTGL